VARTDNFTWKDSLHSAAHAGGNPRRRPMSIYEVHLGSWQRDADGRFLSYNELAESLLPYVVDLGFTHLELLPVSEHPLDASWGYQPIGLFAPTRRHGSPAGFARFIDRAHQAGLSWTGCRRIFPPIRTAWRASTAALSMNMPIPGADISR